MERYMNSSMTVATLLFLIFCILLGCSIFSTLLFFAENYGAQSDKELDDFMNNLAKELDK